MTSLYKCSYQSRFLIKICSIIAIVNNLQAYFTGYSFGKVCENSRAGENPRLRLLFTDLLSNSSKRSPRFSPGYEGAESMFYFLYKIIISNLKYFYSLEDKLHMFSPPVNILYVCVPPIQTFCRTSAQAYFSTSVLL